MIGMMLATWGLFPSESKAKGVYYIKDVNFTDILTYDAAATSQCIHNSFRARPDTRVVFQANGGKVFYWSPSMPQLYFANMGWSDCKGYRCVR